MSMICGLRRYGADRADELDAMLAALPVHQTDVEGRWTGAPASLGD